MALYGEDKSNKKLDKSSEELETSVIINSSKLKPEISQNSSFAYLINPFSSFLPGGYLWLI